MHSTKKNKNTTLQNTYAKAGVNIQVGDAFVKTIQSQAKSTIRSEVITGIGGFASLCHIPQKYHYPVLVSGTDGIGTKLKLGLELDRLETLGIDLVAMCVNDILTVGAEPLFFLDYYACGRLVLKDGQRLISGIVKGCHQAGCTLIGGESAEMPGVYRGRDFDVAGFSVGIVEKSKMIDGSTIRAGDHLIGLASSGPHANGYSLIRHILSLSPDWQKAKIRGKKVSNALITPTRIYSNIVHQLITLFRIKGLAHITGGGLIGNVPRIVPKNLKVEINASSWQVPPIFNWLQKKGGITDAEMLRVFNLGIGMVVIISRQYSSQLLQYLHEHNEQAWVIGHVYKKNQDEPSFIMKS